MRLRRLICICGVVASYGATTAHGADAIVVTLGGRIKEYFVVADQKSAAPTEDLNTAGMFNDVRVSLEGKTVLDNGISVRVYTRFNAVGRKARDVDEAYVDINSTLGRLRIGEKSGTNTSIIGDPVPEAFLTVDEEIIGDALKPRTGIALRDGFTFKRFTGNALGFSLQSPEVLGFRLGAAYHPTLSSAIGLLDKNRNPHNAFDLSAGYDGDFGGGNFRLAGGYFHVASRIGGNDGVSAWNLAAGLAYGGWEASAAYIKSSPANGQQERAWTVGGLYGIGPFKLSAGYRSAKRRLITGGAFLEHVDRTTLQAAYKLGPGISVGLAGFYADQKDALGLTWDSGGALTGVKIDF
ncbi:MAG: porin [Rhodospirillaceae bacterium]|nr:porin [Rhodospirillaceae bacterium]